MTTDDSSEWLTVAEAARRLALSERHARRLAERVPEQDRLKQGTSPLRVRLAAMAQLWERERAESASLTPAPAEPDSGADSLLADAVSRARLEERLDAAETLIVELREDKHRLQETLEREQRNHLRLLEQLSDERLDMRLMHARAVPTLPAVAESAPVFQSAPLPDESEPESDFPSEPPPAFIRPSTAPTTAPAEPPSLWQRLARWISD